MFGYPFSFDEPFPDEDAAEIATMLDERGLEHSVRNVHEIPEPGWTFVNGDGYGIFLPNGKYLFLRESGGGCRTDSRTYTPEVREDGPGSCEINPPPLSVPNQARLVMDAVCAAVKAMLPKQS